MASDTKVQEMMQDSTDSNKKFCDKLANDFADEREKRKVWLLKVVIPSRTIFFPTS